MDLCLFARPHLAPQGDPEQYLALGAMADRAGVAAIAFGEHLVVGQHTQRYPYGTWVHAPDTAWPDPLVVLAAMSTITDRIRLSTGVLLAPLRSGLELAKSVATLDHISGGRVELGVGVGSQREEHVATGRPWHGRQKRLDDVIHVCRRAWGRQPFSLEVDGETLNGLTALPRPIQERVPVLYGVRMSRTNAARIARLGDGWMPVGLDDRALREGVDLLKFAFEDAGRPTGDAIVRTGLPPVYGDDGVLDLARTLRPASELAAAGATQIQLSFNHRMASLAEAEDLIGAALAAVTLIERP